jgi:hypothetical protein
MKSVEVSTVIRRPIAEVYAHLDVLANHEAFTDHFLVDWRLEGRPPASAPRSRCACARRDVARRSS